MTWKNVEAKAKAVVMETASVTSRANKLMKSIQDPADTTLRWANEDRFLGKLNRSVERLERKIGENEALKALADWNTPLSDEFLEDVHASMAVVDGVQKCIDDVEATYKRIMDIEADDQPSQE